MVGFTFHLTWWHGFGREAQRVILKDRTDGRVASTRSATGQIFVGQLSHWGLATQFMTSCFGDPISGGRRPIRLDQKSKADAAKEPLKGLRHLQPSGIAQCLTFKLGPMLMGYGRGK